MVLKEDINCDDMKLLHIDRLRYLKETREYNSEIYRMMFTWEDSNNAFLFHRKVLRTFL